MRSFDLCTVRFVLAQNTQGERFRRAMHLTADYRQLTALETCRESEELFS